MNQIELYDKIQNPIEGIEKLGEMFARSGMFGCEKLEQGQVLAMACLAEKKTPFELKRTYHLLPGGELSMRSDAMLADFRSKGGRHKVIKRTSDEASVTLVLGENSETFTLTFEDVKQEPFVYQRDGKTLKKNWASPRARTQMLWSRVISDGVRTLAPEIVSGVYTPEENQDFTPQKEAKPLFAEKNITPTQGEQDASSKTNSDNPAPADKPTGTSGKSSPASPPSLKAVVDPKTGNLSTDTVDALLNLIPVDLTTAAHDFLIKQKWIKEGETLNTLTQKRCQMIFNKPEAFIKKLGGEK